MDEKTNHMQGKICLVTGATSGIGKVSAEALAGMGARVIVGARNLDKAERTVADIRTRTGNDEVEYLLADLSIQAEVRRLAEKVQEQYTHLDVLLNNAGAMYFRRQVSADGFELTWATNHLNYFLLTQLLLPMLEKSAAGRVVNVASSAHWRGVIQFDDLQFERGYSPMKVYGQSKLANILFTRELARRLEGSQVTANAVHPGLVATNFGQNFGLARLIGKIFLSGAKSAEEGAQTLIYLASSAEVQGVTGKFFVDLQEAPSSDRSKDEALARQLWEVSEEMVAVVKG